MQSSFNESNGTRGTTSEGHTRKRIRTGRDLHNRVLFVEVGHREVDTTSGRDENPGLITFVFSDEPPSNAVQFEFEGSFAKGAKRRGALV